MVAYLLVAFGTMISGTCLTSLSNDRLCGMDEQLYLKRQRRLLAFVFLLWLFIFAFHGGTGTDSMGYRRSYQSIYLNHIELSDLIDQNRDYLFSVVNYYISNLFKGSWIAACTVYGALIYIPILYLIRKRSQDDSFSILFYVFTLAAFTGFNGTRQAISFGFVLLAYYFGFRERKYLKYVLLMAVAIGFHSGAMFAIPFHFISKKKLKSFSTVILIFAMVAGLIFLTEIWGNVISVLSWMGQEKMVGDYIDLTFNNGSSIIRQFVVFAPVILAFIVYPDLSEKYPDVDSDLILAICAAIFSLYSLKNWIFARVASFMNVEIILFPKIVNAVEGKNRRTIRTIILVLYFAYMIIMLLHGESHLYPYKPVWSTGLY